MPHASAPRTAKAPPKPAAKAPTAQPSGTAAADPTLEALQAKADGSPAVAQLQRMTSRANGVVQREVDTSSSPFLPDYEDDETPGWDTKTGVPQWAKDQYEAEAQTTLICSMKNGKIGSIYFPGGRIRTTHGSGPEKAPDKSDRAVQRYNLHLARAQRIFDAANTDLFPNLYWKTDVKLPKEDREKLARKEYDRAFKRWLSNQLISIPNDSLPNWIVPVTGPDTAHDPEDGAPDPVMKLFEVFVRVSDGKVAGWHPSRGVATKFATNKQVISVLEAAVKHIDGVKDVNERNKQFYTFIQKRIPEFAKLIRSPEEVAPRPKKT
ncbi:hypothetical protein [uncultured Roseobacter sp.]|uniref:hypothetical protein n=1 Tax=uncultured Roseobacter sp. TaxID=114847 RepID=UPI00261705DA|nr:hypothetical protein [uncultured Roseobacter sp.]